MVTTLIDGVFDESIKYLEQMPKEKRKSIGQFFTSKETARYMASMFCEPTKENLSILDPGAGSGILTAAVIDRLQSSATVKRIQITCYEISNDVLPILKRNLAFIKANSNIAVDYIIFEKNYITSQSDDFNESILANQSPEKYDWIICNPPYRKIMKNATEATSMPAVCYGAPNLYFLFTAMGLFNLDKQGEMVYIIPRSWTSGAYFRRFRDYLFDHGTLKSIHLFISRDKVFEKESVLQETIIIKVDHSKRKDLVRITCSNSNSDFKNITSIDMPYSSIIVGEEKYVYLVTSSEESTVLKKLGGWGNTLPSLGLRMRTGLTVDFRSRNYLRDAPEDGTVPLLYAQHIKGGRVVFPVQRDSQYITTEKASLLQRNKNYLLVKRFTAKEEKRRLQCGVYLSDTLPQYKQISTQNKVNFIEGVNFNLSDQLVFGLFVLFNSTIYDQYYRILNGSTQVNSTEINAMPVPPINDIEKLGSIIIKTQDFSVESCDRIIGGLFYEKN